MTNLEMKKLEADLELTRAQTSLALKQSQTEFWKIGVALIIAGAAFGGVLVQIASNI